MDILEEIKKINGEIEGRFIADKDTWSDYPGVGKVTDYDVYRHLIKHVRWFDILNQRAMTHYALTSQLVLFGVIEEPKDPNWKYPI